MERLILSPRTGIFSGKRDLLKGSKTVFPNGKSAFQFVSFYQFQARSIISPDDLLASLWCSLLTISSNSLIDNDSRLSESVGIPALSNASQYDKLGKIIRIARL